VINQIIKKMKHSKKIPLIACLFLLAGSSVFGQQAYTLKSHKISVDGTSSLHDWTSDVTKVGWSGKLTVEGKIVKAISDVIVTIAVTDIKSEKGGMMDDKTYEAFNWEKYPTITFNLKGATITGSTIKANGTLTMAGVTKPIVMNVASKVLPDGSVHLSGSQPINMKDYKMTPPKAVMGTIKVGEKVTLLFELTVTPG
jgi:polyisoprenoid-binding protein YceI